MFGGLFSGNKKSATTNSTTTNNSSTLGIQGDLSGILGDGNYVFTDQRQTDINVDNSDNSDRSDNSRIDWNQDNSDNSDRRFDGQFAGAAVGGDLIVTGDGAWQFGNKALDVLGDTMQTALNNSTEQSYVAIKAAQDSAANALAFGSDSLRSVENTSRYSIDSMRENSRDAIDGVLFAGKNASETIAQTAERLAQTSESSTKAAIDASNEAMQRNAALIQTTALGGQDLMIDAMKKVMMYGAAALGLGFLFMTFSGGRK